MLENTRQLPDADDATRRTYRVWMAQYVGAKTYPRSALNKTTLNSIHAYITGSFAYPPMVRHRENNPDYKSRPEVRRDVALEVFPESMEDRWRQETDALPSQYSKNELHNIAAYLHNNPDQREWT